MAKKTIQNNNILQYNRNSSDFFNTEYKEWAKSVIEERALPLSLIHI